MLSMRLCEKMSDTIWKFPADSNVYLVTLDEPVVIDTGSRANRTLIAQYMDKVCALDSVRKVIFTHLHFDHIGNFDLFPNAEFYASAQAIADLRRNPRGTVLNDDMLDKFNISLRPLREGDEIGGLKVIETPGHTRGSICLWYEKENTLFSGDTLMKNGFGRTDLPTSAPELQGKTITKLLGYSYMRLCTGHEY